LRGQKPPLAAYPREVTTVGDHLRTRLLELRLRQEDLAKQLGVSKDTIRNWEVGRHSPAVWQWPSVTQFLGCVPGTATGDSSSLGDRLRSYRRLRGLSQERLARLPGVDDSTVWQWERRKSQPRVEHATRIEGLLSIVGLPVGAPVPSEIRGDNGEAQG